MSLKHSWVAQLFVLTSGILLATSAHGQSLTVSADPSAFTVFPGQQHIPVTVTVQGADSALPLTITFAGLPSGISFTPATLTGSGSATLYLNASVSAGQEGLPPSGASTISWTAYPTVIAANGSTLTTAPLALTISVSNPAFVPSTVDLPIVNINTNGVPIIDKDTDVPGTISITSPNGQM